MLNCWAHIEEKNTEILIKNDRDVYRLHCFCMYERENKKKIKNKIFT